MYDNEKIWAIDLGEDLEVTREDRKPSEPTVASEPASERDRETARPRLRKVVLAQSESGKKKPRRLHFALLVPLTFLLGPLAILLTPEGRRKRDWAVLGLVLGAAWAAALVWGRAALVRVGTGPSLGPTVVVLLSILISGFLVWARAVHSAGIARPANHRLPRWLTRPFTVGLLGMLAPGMGLLAAGRNRRAAAVLFLTAAPVAGWLLLDVSGLWWPAVRAGASTLDAREFERLLLAAAALVALGVFGWVAQALEGARLVQMETGAPTRGRGDLYGLALMGSLAAMLAMSDPAPVARYLGREARQLQAEGFLLVPVTMVRTAAVLDPGRTDYMVTAVELYEEMGRRDTAAELRTRLENDLKSYLDLVRQDQDRDDPVGMSETSPRIRSYLAAGPIGWFEYDAFTAEKDPETQASGSGEREE